MNLIENINSVGQGSEFVRADLHIHSYGSLGSYDVTDDMMTPQNIVNIAIENNLKIISITDHNEIENSKVAIEYSTSKSILVIPGIELNTIQGHLLLYFKEFSELKNFFGKLSISPEKDICNNGIIECLNLAKEFNGFGILAHIDRESGFELTIGKFNNHLEIIILHKNLMGLEISDKESYNFYTSLDDNPERRALLNKRIRKHDLSMEFEFPKLMSSDAHSIKSLGLNAEGEKKLTRIKVDSLSFHSFKIALLTPNSRIRLENFIPESYPYFCGLQFSGGFLDKQVIKFSKNLTCIIGGRGAGKSTLLESIRVTSGNLSMSTIIDSDVWSDEISLVYEDETGNRDIFQREKNNETINKSDPNKGITKVTIESYGQGETASTIQNSDKNPKFLLDFLDSFIEIENLKFEDREIINLLLENQSELNILRLEVNNIPETEKQKYNAEKKLTLLKTERVGELVEYHTSLLKERSFRTNLIKDLNDLVIKYRKILSDKEVFQNVSELTDEDIIIGKDNFNIVKKIVHQFSQIVEKLSLELQQELNTKINELKIQLNQWKEKEKGIQDKIDLKKKELELKGIPFDIGRINQISKDAIYYQEKLKKLNKKKGLLKEKLEERKTHLSNRKKIKDEIYKIRSSYANQLNLNLKNTIEDFFVKIKFLKGLYSPEFEKYIKAVMDYRTVQVPKSKFIAEQISPFDFVKSVKKINFEALKKIKNNDGQQLLDTEEIKRIFYNFKEDNRYEDVECLNFEDNPKITVTRQYQDPTGQTRHLIKSLSQLSLGQQQSILLAILLHSKNNNPLIIDQPEDNLDSEFIYKSIVKNLRKIKEQRQVIIVTHNPNIAVLGDAELIIPLKSTSLKSMIIDRGSIDKSETRKITCEILEGGKQAFIQRKKIYGI